MMKIAKDFWMQLLEEGHTTISFKAKGVTSFLREVVSTAWTQIQRDLYIPNRWLSSQSKDPICILRSHKGKLT